MRYMSLSYDQYFGQLIISWSISWPRRKKPEFGVSHFLCLLRCENQIEAICHRSRDKKRKLIFAYKKTDLTTGQTTGEILLKNLLYEWPLVGFWWPILDLIRELTHMKGVGWSKFDMAEFASINNWLVLFLYVRLLGLIIILFSHQYFCDFSTAMWMIAFYVLDTVFLFIESFFAWSA